MIHLLRTVIVHLILVSLCLASTPLIKEYDPTIVPDVGDFHGSLQDSRGFIWFWGDKGVSYYDGHSFHVFNERHGLLSNYCYNVVEGKNGDMYIGTTNGMCVFQPKAQNLKPLNIFQHTPVRDIDFFENDLLIAWNGGVMLARENALYRFVTPHPVLSREMNRMANDILYDEESGLLWMASDRAGVFAIDVEEQLPLFELKNEEITKQYQASGNNLFDGSKFDKKYPHIRDSATDGLFPIIKIAQPYKSELLTKFPALKIDYNTENQLDSSAYVIDDYAERERILRKSSTQYLYDQKSSYWAVLKIFKDYKNRIFAYATNGLFVLKDGQFVRFEHKLLDNIETIQRAYSDSYGSIYIIGVNGCVILGEKEERYVGAKDKPINSIVSFCLRDRELNYWLFSDANSRVARMTTSNIKLLSLDDKLKIGAVFRLLKHPDSNLYILGHKGLASYKDNTVNPISLKDFPDGIEDAILDKNGNIIAASRNYLYLIDPLQARIENLTERLSNHEGKIVFTSDQQGSVWISLSNNLYKWDGEALSTIKALKSNPDKSFDTHYFPNHIFSTDDGNLFISTWRGIIKVRGEKVWWYRFTDITLPDGSYKIIPEGNLRTMISSLCGAVGPDGAKWFGTFDAGIIRLQGDSIRAFDRRHGISTTPYYKVSVDPQGNLYFISDFSILKVGEKGISPFKVNILENESIKDLIFCGDNSWFLITSHGIWVQENELRYRLDSGLGLPFGSVKQTVKLDNNQILFAQDQDLIILNGEEYLPYTPSPVEPCITTFTSNDQKFLINDQINLPRGNRAIRIGFTLPEYFNENIHHFSWKLEGYEYEYTDFSSQHSAEYANLDPGVYRFSLRAKNSFGMISELDEEIDIIVPAYFWETPSFMFAMAIVLSLITIAIVRYRIQQLRMQRERLAMIVDQKTEELQMENRKKAVLIDDLQEALDKIQVLDGLVPICANCKKIRDDKGFWNQLENYITEHSNATFTHGICPDCMKHLYPDIDLDKDESEEQ